MTNPSVLPVLVVTVMSAACASASLSVVRPPSSQLAQQLPYENPDYPPYDQSIWRGQREGLVAKAASASLAQASAAPEAPALLAEAHRLDDALQALRALVDQHPQRMARAFELLEPHLHLFSDDRLHPDRRDTLQQVGLRARQQAMTLPREQAAAALARVLFLEWFLSGGGRAERTRQLDAFVKEYAGTDAPLMAEVDAISQDPGLFSQIANFRKFAADHVHTTAAAKALYLAGFQLGVNVAVTGAVPRGGDPTDRVFQEVELMRALQSGRYPPSEWVAKAPSLVLGVFASQPVYASGNIDRLLAVYQAIVNQYLFLANPGDQDAAVGALMKMAGLFKINGAGAAGMDHVFAEMEQRRAQQANVRYLKGLFYIKAMIDAKPEDRQALIAKATESFTTAQEDGTGMYQRRALAALASLYFVERDFANARDGYRRYLQTYPQSPWSWVAALRLGESLQGLGEEEAAAGVYRAAAETYRTNAVARTVSYAFAARALESLDRLDEALLETQHALEGWDTDFGQVYSVSMGYPGIPGDLLAGELRLEQLTQRVAQLKESLRTVDGRLLEQGRSLLDRGETTEALAPLEQLLRSSSGSKMAIEARLLVHRARLFRALDRAGLTSGRDMSVALAELDLITRDEYDVGVFAAKIARASLMWKRAAVGTDAGDAVSQAQTQMREALREWQLQEAALGNTRATAVGRDVSEIRDIVFRPDGGGIYGAWARDRFQRQGLSRPFLVVNPEVLVKFADGARSLESSYQAIEGREQVLFFTTSQLLLLRDVQTRIDGTQDGRASTVSAFWNQFFPENPREGGWVLESAPVIRDIEYLDTERTHAAARVAVGSEGCTVILEKAGGIWSVVRLVDMWIA